MSFQGKRMSATQAIALAKPGFMRLETLNFLNQPLLIAATDGVSFEAMVLAENRFYRGSVSRGLARFMGLRMESEALVSMFFGEIPYREAGSIAYAHERGLFRLNFPRSPQWEAQTFWIHPKTLRVVEVSKIDHMGQEIRISFKRFRKTRSVAFPREIEIEASGSGSLIRLDFRKVTINVPLPEELFRLPVPPGAEVVEMDELG
ncbi:MAG: DUF4292 domain-containing protein [Deltaproteobacteria bacterium]|nr:DUF4292 domain-containing protein [Deltaproteobacteria bacterium]